MTKVITGLDQLIHDQSWQGRIKGKIGLLCHSATVDGQLQSGIGKIKSIFGERLIKLFGPQHGLVCDVQDNMIESEDHYHPYYNLKVYSLYSKTRRPTEEMLKGIETLIIDLVDVGTRVYTYISTLRYCLEECAKRGIDVVVLDRPNPLGGAIIEGNLLEEGWGSFVGEYPFPMRHGLTMGEVALFARKEFKLDLNLTIIPVKGWRRDQLFHQSGLPWVLPSPNLPTFESALCFPGTVLFEGTELSEGRGTTTSLQIVGHPHLEPHSFLEKIERNLLEFNLQGFILRPLIFRPMFQKFKNTSCGGLMIHPTDPHLFRPWALGQYLMYQLYTHLGPDFSWKREPYEYEFERSAMDLINGSEKVRKTIEGQARFEKIIELEQSSIESFKQRREDAMLYT